MHTMLYCEGLNYGVVLLLDDVAKVFYESIEQFEKGTCKEETLKLFLFLFLSQFTF